MRDRVLSRAVEYVEGKLYYVALKNEPVETPERHFFSTDDTLEYFNFYLDFGPLNLSHVFRFCAMIKKKLRSRRLNHSKIIYYSSTHPHQRTNSAFLICAYGILCMNLTPKEAFAPFDHYYPKFSSFHDASNYNCTYNLTIMDCLNALFKARDNKFFNFDSFDADEYEKYERVENGDLNWIIEGKFLAFAGPHANNHSLKDYPDYITLTPEDYIPYFNQRDVKTVIRLNKRVYSAKRFLKHGINHHDIYYLDGSNPPANILQTFLQICENSTGAIAVHCKAGLGRTGTCIGAYLMKHYQLTAAEAIGWLRITRPGSVIGPQQHFLEKIQMKMWKAGESFYKKPDQLITSGCRVTGTTRSETRSLQPGGKKRYTTGSNRMRKKEKRNYEHCERESDFPEDIMDMNVDVAYSHEEHNDDIYPGRTSTSSTTSCSRNTNNRSQGDNLIRIRRTNRSRL